MRDTSHSLYAPSHTEPIGNIKSFVEVNLEVVESISSDILELLDKPKTVSEIQSELCTGYGLNMYVVQQYYLIHTTLMTYLSHLYKEKVVEIKLEGNSLC